MTNDNVMKDDNNISILTNINIMKTFNSNNEKKRN
jgi:hypothetical protein